MASAASKSFVGSSFHNLSSHVILSPPTREDVNLTLSPSSSFLSNYSSMCSTPKSSIAANFVTSSFAYSGGGGAGGSANSAKEALYNNTCPGASRPDTMNQSAEQVGMVDKTASIDTQAGDVFDKAETSDSSSSSPSSSDEHAANSKDEAHKSEDESKEAAMAVFVDENSSNSNSTQSSDNTNGSARKKRRRGEEQILMEDLIGIDKSLADGIANHIRSSPCKRADPSSAVQMNDLPSLTSQQTADGEPKKSKEDSPAFHLRPRRSVKSTSFSGYCSGSGSSSPISFLFSPIKRTKQPLMKKSINTYTQQLLSDTSKQLSQFLNDQQGTSGQNGVDSKETIDLKPPPPPPPPKPLIRPYSRSILSNMDVSVFAELITPLELASCNVYSNNYLALQICDIKPLRHVVLLHPETQDKLSSPLLELVTLDINDRFVLSHTKGIFDASPFSQAPNKHLTVYLLGTYALMANELASKGKVVNIVKFRTTKPTKLTAAMQPPKKRKLLASTKLSSDSDDTSQHFPFRVIVDALSDITAVSQDQKSISPVKEEFPDSGQQPSEIEDASPAANEQDVHFEELFKNSPHIGSATDLKWVPLVSFSDKWRAPDDPKELNKSLHVLQPSIPKFESASRTVKMNP